MNICLIREDVNDGDGRFGVVAGMRMGPDLRTEGATERKQTWIDRPLGNCLREAIFPDSLMHFTMYRLILLVI